MFVLGYPSRRAGAFIAIAPLTEPHGDIVPARHFRSTWIVASVVAMRESKHFPAYCDHLGPHREEILSCIAGMWLPLSVARAHYLACDALPITDEEHIAMARAGAHIRRSWHASMLAGAERRSATPWTVLPMLRRFWERSADGGEAGVYQTGPRRAVVQYVNCALFDIAFFRRATAVLIQLLAARVCTEPVVRQDPRRPPGGCSYSVQWRGTR